MIHPCDRQTDGRAIAYTRYSIYAVARKNELRWERREATFHWGRCCSDDIDVKQFKTHARLVWADTCSDNQSQRHIQTDNQWQHHTDIGVDQSQHRKSLQKATWPLSWRLNNNRFSVIKRVVFTVPKWNKFSNVTQLRRKWMKWERFCLGQFERFSTIWQFSILTMIMWSHRSTWAMQSLEWRPKTGRSMSRTWLRGHLQIFRPDWRKNTTML